MKKLIVLMLVLGLAASANATIVVLDSGSGTTQDVAEFTPGSVTLYIQSTTANIQMHDVEFIADNGATIGTGTEVYAGTNSPVMAAYNYIGPGLTAGYTEFVSGWDNGLLFDANADLYSFVVSYGSLASGTTITVSGQDVYTVDSGWQPLSLSVNSYLIEVIPEPMTIALLGLGGLFIRRKK